MKTKKTVTNQTATTLLVTIAVISFWRGAWGLMDIYLFPDNQTLSFLISLSLGIALLYSTNYIIKEFMS